MSKWFWPLAYLATIPAANWSIGHLGACAGAGPCVIPVGFGLLAPSGVLWIGLALTLRDLAQDATGRRGVLAAIVGGALLSVLIAPALAVASGAAFLISELADFAVYTPLRGRSWWGAILASNAVGLLVDSVLFLWLAFGSLDFLVGQVIGKAEATLITVGVLALWRWWGARRTFANEI